MKKKLIGLAVCLLALGIAAAAGKMTEKESKRYHQHLEEPGYIPCKNHGEETFCSHLPLILIDTGGEEIPGVPLSEEKDTAFTKTADGSDYLKGFMTVVDNKTGNNHIGDTPAQKTDISIRVRGNSSRYFDKKSYLVKTVKDDKENDLPLLGMDSFDEWALYGPYLDKTLIRNYMWYNIAGEMMEYAPNVRFCEVFLNGNYQGLYVLTETISSGDEGRRLGLTKPDEKRRETSYVLRIDRGSSNPVRNIDTFTRYTLRNLYKLNIEYPGTRYLTEERREYILQDFSAFEKKLYSFDYDNGPYAWENDMDMKSMADFFIFTEFTCNYDAGNLSTYLYKDIGGKYKMCVWDCNSVCDNYRESTIASQHFETQGETWYYMLSKDETFVETVIDRYREFREGVLNEQYIDNYIDSVVEWLGPSVERNYQAWDQALQYNRLLPPSRNVHTHIEAVNQMKEFCHKRGEWMDEHIEILRQYCHESKVKKFNH